MSQPKCRKCQNGWRIPSELDWNELSTQLGGHKVAGGRYISQKNHETK